MIETGAGKYGADILFKKGLNIIFGPNSVGKTSIITGIIYGLGSEKGLGVFKSAQNPFKPEFYSIIEGQAVTKSYLFLEISNGDKIASIFRYIKGGDANIAAVNTTTIDGFSKGIGKRLIVSGEGVFSANGFQKFLFEFLNLEEVELPTYEQKLSKLYFENILPLFFVEQRAGWSQIQARQVQRYNIREVKKVAFEYIMGLDRFNLHLKEIRKRELEESLKSKSEELEKKEDNLVIISNGEKSEDILLVNSSIGRTSIYDYLRYLTDKYSAETKALNEITSQNQSYEDKNSKLRDSLKRLDFQMRRVNAQIEKITTELQGYENYLDRIRKNKFKNKQLRKIQEISSDLNISACPVCETPLTHGGDRECQLCHSDLTKKISTPEENLIFLEDEENTFKKVIKQRTLDSRKLIVQRDNFKDKIIQAEKELEHQTSTFAGKEFARLRERILEIDSIHKELEKYRRISDRWEELKPLRQQIKKLLAELDKVKTDIAKYIQTQDDIKILEMIKDNIKGNLQSLGLFKANPALIDKIRLDENDNYSPYLDEFDIYNISSSSDNIRIILSFYLALLQTSIQLSKNGKIRFPNLLILDEPKQQNLDSGSLMNGIKVLEGLPVTNSQIILTTYTDLKSDKTQFQKYIVFEMEDSKDYLLKKLPEAK